MELNGLSPAAIRTFAADPVATRTPLMAVVRDLGKLGEALDAQWEKDMRFVEQVRTGGMRTGRCGSQYGRVWDKT